MLPRAAFPADLFVPDDWGSVCLPSKKARARAPSGARTRDKGQTQVTRPANRVLLIGSIRELALYRAEVLRHSGFTVLTPRNKAEAVAAIERGEFDAAILTYTLPTELVEELAELLRQTCPDCPIICISQEGKKDRRIAPDEVVLAEHGPTALLEALRRTLRSRVQ